MDNKKELKQKTLQSVKKTIAELENVSDVELFAGLKQFNIDSLQTKVNKGRSIWDTEFKNSYSDNEKKARRLIRNQQLKYSKQLLSALIQKSDYKNCAENLHKFYKTGLVDFAIYSNVSEKESPDKFAIIKNAYQKMKIILDIK